MSSHSSSKRHRYGDLMDGNFAFSGAKSLPRTLAGSPMSIAKVTSVLPETLGEDRSMHVDEPYKQEGLSNGFELLR